MNLGIGIALFIVSIAMIVYVNQKHNKLIEQEFELKKEKDKFENYVANLSYPYLLKLKGQFGKPLTDDQLRDLGLSIFDNYRGINDGIDFARKGRTNVNDARKMMCYLAALNENATLAVQEIQRRANAIYDDETNARKEEAMQ